MATKKKRDYSKRVRKYWVPKFKGKTITVDKLKKDVLVLVRQSLPGQGVDPVVIGSALEMCCGVIRTELTLHREFVLEGVGRFYLMRGRSGQSFVKFSSKYNR